MSNNYVKWHDSTVNILIMTASSIYEFLIWTREELHRMAKFAIVGGTGALLHLGILAGLTSGLGLWYLVSACIASVVNITWNFTLNERWTFKDRKQDRTLKRYIKYFGTMLATGVLYFGALTLLIEVGELWYLPSAIIAVGVQVIANFGISYFWIWRNK